MSRATEHSRASDVRSIPAGPVIACALLAAAALAVGALQPISNADTFGHLAQGQVIAEAGWPPPLDPFSFWREEPARWVNYEWLSDVATWGVYRAAGWGGLLATAMLLMALAGAGLVLLTSRRAGPGAAWLASLIVIASMPAIRFRLSARPHLIAAPFAVAYLWILTSQRAFATRRRAAITIGGVAALHVLWANLHGSHLLGIAIAGASALAALPDRKRAAMLGLATGATLLAACVSPYGPAITLDALSHVLDPAYRGVVSEWLPITTLGWSWATVHVALHCSALALVARRAMRGGLLTRTWFAVAVLLAIAGVLSVRFVEELLLLGAPIVAIVLADLAREPLDRIAGTWRAPIYAALAAGLALAGAARTDADLRSFAGGLDTRFVPAEAAEHVEQRLPGARVLASIQSSWYLLFGAPHARVLVDGRVPFYGPDHVRAMGAALAEPGALGPVLARHDADTVLVQHTAPNERAALEALASDPAFVRTWIDAHFAVYVRADRARGLDAARLDALPVTLAPAEVLGATPEQVRQIRTDLANIGGGPDARAYRAFVRAMLRLRPLAREGGWAGYRPPTDEHERREVELALRELEATRARVGAVPVIEAHLALVATLACRLADARAHLDSAVALGVSRETIFAEPELALREGRTEAARAFVVQARGIPAAATDPWVDEIGSGLLADLRCRP